MNHARELPERAAILASQADLDISQWQGFESVGYVLADRIMPSTPSWFCFDWMPAVQDWKRRHVLLVYRLKDGEV